MLKKNRPYIERWHIIIILLLLIVVSYFLHENVSCMIFHSLIAGWASYPPSSYILVILQWAFLKYLFADHVAFL